VLAVVQCFHHPPPRDLRVDVVGFSLAACCGAVGQDETWQVVDADSTIEALQADLVGRAEAVISAAATAPLGKLWME
jgi:hypothetical protein